MVNAQGCQELFQFFDGQAASEDWDDQTTNPKNTLKAATPRLLVAALWVAKDVPLVQHPTVSM